MQNFLNRINKSFGSKQLERLFFEQQIPGIIEFHKLVTVVLFFYYALIIMLVSFRHDFTMLPVMLTLAFMNLCQYVYFRIKPSAKCLTIINIYNIGVACLRFYQATQIEQQLKYNFNYNSSYFTGGCYFTIHIILLVNPSVTTNIMVMMCIFLINMACAWIIDSSLFIQGIGMLIYISLLIWKLRLDLQAKRNLFIIKGEKSKWENILRVLIEQPYVIFDFAKEELKFNFMESNQAGKSIDINDSQSMRIVFRRLKIMDESSQNLEQFIFNLIRSVDQIKSEVKFDYQEVMVYDLKIKYSVKIFLLDQDLKTVFMTFNNISQSEAQTKQPQTIINQQIGFCNLVKKQFQFCQQLKEKTLKDQKSNLILIEKQMLDLINYMNIFKTDQQINPSKVNLRGSIIKIKQLFPNQTILVNGNIEHLVSDASVINQIFYNLLSLLDEKNTNKVFIVRIKRNIDQINAVQIEILSKIRNFKQIVSQNYLNLSLNNLAQIQKKGSLQYLMIQKQLQLVSPHKQLQLKYDDDQSKKNYNKLDYVKLQFNLYHNLGATLE